MPEAEARLDEWIETVSALAAAFERGFEARFGYSPGENRVVLPLAGSPSLVLAARGAGLPSELLELYSHLHGVTFPDLGNGIFVHPLQSIVDELREYPGTRLNGAVDDSVVVFGSDGGGSLFALSTSGRGVYRVSGAALIGAVYDVDEGGLSTVSADLWGFLVWIREELRSATDGEGS